MEMNDKDCADKTNAADRDSLRMFVWMSMIAFAFAVLAWLGLCNHI